VGEALTAGYRNEAISLLLQLGALKAVQNKLSIDMTDEQWVSLMDYTVTEFGDALVEYLTHAMGVQISKVSERGEEGESKTSDSTKNVGGSTQ
jgi:hypothetical protein